MPIQIIRRKIEAKPNEVLVERADGVYAYPKQIATFQTKTKITPQDYALVQQGEQAIIAISMQQGFNGLQFVPANIAVLNSGLFVPSPSIFMPHYKNVNEALQEKGVVYDASGSLIEKGRLNAYANTLNYRCGVHLNARFPKGKGFCGLDLVTIIGLDEEGEPILKREHLEDGLEFDDFAELESLNSQGFPTKRAKIQKYEPGKTVYFMPPLLREDNPEEGSVARFYVSPDEAILGCGGNPRSSDAEIGVFPCAEGAEKI